MQRTNWTVTTLLAVGAVLFLAPVVWMVSTAFKTDRDIFGPPHWVPRPVTMSNFTSLASKREEAPILRWVANSLFVSGAVVGLTLLVCSLAAYPLARMRFPGRDALFYVIIAAMAVPGQATMIPTFLVVEKLGWFDTYPALIVPALAAPFGVFLLRQFMRGLPRELEEAATIDGCGPWGTWARVIVPLCRPILATLAVLTFLGAWNDFLWPLIATNSLEMRTIPVGITVLQGRYASDFGLMMAVATVASIPVVLAFLLLQRFLVRGISLTGLK